MAIRIPPPVLFALLLGVGLLLNLPQIQRRAEDRRVAFRDQELSKPVPVDPGP